MAGSVGAVLAESVGVAPERQDAVVAKPPEASRASLDEEVEKKSAWNRPSNGSLEAGSVMGAKSWPPLSESARVLSPKPSSSDLLNNVAEGSGSESTGASDSDHPTRPTSNTNPNFGVPTRYKSYRRVNSGTGSSSYIRPNGEPAMQSPFPQEESPAVSGRNDQPRDPSNKNSGNWDRGSRPDKLSLQNGRNEPHGGHGAATGNRRGNYGSGPHKKLGTRREHDHRHDWKPQWNGRDMQFPQQHHQRPFHRPIFHAPATGPVSFINHPPAVPVRPYIIPVPDIYHQMLYIHTPIPPPEIYNSFSHVSSPTMYYPALDYQLSSALLKQIHYYFSDENLCKDMFLRQNMNEEGWVPISLIANFNRVKSLTTDIPLILETVRSSSSILEVQDDRIRRRGDWKHWIWHSPGMTLADAVQDLQMQYSSMNLQQK